MKVDLRQRDIDEIASLSLDMGELYRDQLTTTVQRPEALSGALIDGQKFWDDINNREQAKEVMPPIEYGNILFDLSDLSKKYYPMYDDWLAPNKNQRTEWQLFIKELLFIRDRLILRMKIYNLKTLDDIWDSLPPELAYIVDMVNLVAYVAISGQNSWSHPAVLQIWKPEYDRITLIARQRKEEREAKLKRQAQREAKEAEIAKKQKEWDDLSEEAKEAILKQKEAERQRQQEAEELRRSRKATEKRMFQMAEQERWMQEIIDRGEIEQHKRRLKMRRWAFLFLLSLLALQLGRKILIF